MRFETSLREVSIGFLASEQTLDLVISHFPQSFGFSFTTHRCRQTTTPTKLTFVDVTRPMMFWDPYFVSVMSY